MKERKAASGVHDIPIHDDIYDSLLPVKGFLTIQFSRNPERETDTQKAVVGKHRLP